MDMDLSAKLECKVKNHEDEKNSAMIEEASNKDASLEQVNYPGVMVAALGQGSTRDFSQLPTVVWVNILSRLSIIDRYKVSLTCHALYEVFNHPSVWHTMKLNVNGNSLRGTSLNWTFGKIPTDDGFVIPGTYVTVVNKFGRFFKKLTISVSGFLQGDCDVWDDFISEVTTQCRLQNLTLEVGNMATREHLDWKSPDKRNILSLVYLIRKASHIKSFRLVSWPLYSSSLDKPEEDIILALIENPKLRDLESLSLFWTEKKSWTERSLLLVPPAKMLCMVSHFKNLSSLSLQSPMIDDRVLREFCSSRESQLKLLRIFVNYNDYIHILSIPKISSQTWENVSTANPELSVEVTLFSRVPNVELAKLLQPGCPLTNIKFTRYSRCDEQLVSQLCDDFSTTIRVFECHGDFADADKALTRLVAESPQLDRLIIAGTYVVNYRTAMEILSLRGRKWKNLIFEQMSYEDDVLEDSEENKALARVGKPKMDEEEKVRRRRQFFNFMSRELGLTWTRASYMEFYARRKCLLRPSFKFGDRISLR